MIPDGATIMYGGFLGCGSAHHIIEALAQKGTKDLTIIGNDCGMATGPNGEEFYGVAKLVHNHQVKHVIATHVGMTPDVGTQGMVDKTLTVDLIPQGTLAEMIRAGGAGLGGAMDLLVGAKEVIVAMEHTAKGNPKILKKCRLPYTAVHCITKIITEMCVINVTDKGLELVEINPEFTVEQVQAATEATLIVSPDLKPMC